MFDRKWVPLLPWLRARMPGRGTGLSSTRQFPIGLAVVLALTSSLVTTSPANAYEAAGELATGPSIQYQEATAHAAESYSFGPGGVATVPYRPRAGDMTEVDGATPVALPAGQGTAPVTPDATNPEPVTTNGVSLLRREVLGFLPYWQLATTLDYDTISTIAYFGIDLNTDGTLDKAGNGWNGWVSDTMTSVINAAHAHGTRVALTVESFAWDSNGAWSQTALLSSPTASLAAAQNIAAEVGRRGADGVDLDFEPIAPGQSANYIAFVKTLRTELDKVHKGYELTFCATAEPNTYDLEHLLAPGAADAVFIMGYDLRGGSPKNTGSIDPLTSPWVFDLSDSITRFLAQVAPSKVILGLPWYGHAWSTGGPFECTACHAVNAPQGNLDTYGQPAAVPYFTAADLSGMSDSTHLGKSYDTVEQTAWTAYYGNYGGTQDTWRELYFDDARALGAKCDAIDGWNLRGVGIWALGYDDNGGDGDLTATIAAKYETGAKGTTYHPMTPARLLDTRYGNGLSVKLSANTPATFQVTGRAGIPSGATAVTGNVTVVNPTFSWAIYLGPDPMPFPSTSTLNFLKGEAKANGLTAALAADGSLSATYMSVAGNTTDLVFDVTGYFTPDTSGATYHALDPARLVDTRIGNGLSSKLSANTPATFHVIGRAGIPSDATAVTGNVTVVNPTFSWAIYLGPDPITSPTTSTLNFLKGEAKGNGVTVALGAGGMLSATYMSYSGNTTDLVFDVTGYYTRDLTGGKFVPITATRLLDTRVGNGLSTRLSANTPATFQVAGRAGIPDNATAVTGNVTVVNPTCAWAIFVGPDPDPNPTTSTLNFLRGEAKANGVTVALGSGGTVSATFISYSGNTTDLVFDVTGYYGP